jgi:predicted RNase H-like HicB family nuclease
MRKKPERYIYPGVFSYDEDGISVWFPDLPGCNTCGATQEETMNRAKEALAGHLSCMEDDGDLIPEPSDMRKIKTEPQEVIALVEAWMLPLGEKTVRKNLTIPARLADQAEKTGINFSQFLTDALEKELGIQS